MHEPVVQRPPCVNQPVTSCTIKRVVKTGCCAGVRASLRSRREERVQYTLASQIPVPLPSFRRGGGKADILSERPVCGVNRRRLERKSNKGNKFGPIFDTWRSAVCARRLQYIVDTSCALAPAPSLSLPVTSKLTPSLFPRAPPFPISQRAGQRARARRHSLYLRSASCFAICFGSDDWYRAIRHRLDGKVKSLSRHILGDA